MTKCISKQNGSKLHCPQQKTMHIELSTHTGLKKTTRNPWMVFQKEMASF